MTIGGSFPLVVPARTPQDAPLVHAIMRAAFAEYEGTLDPPSGANTETVVDVERAMLSGGALVAWADRDTPVGTARWLLEQDALYVGRVSVLPSHRQRGIATALMRAAEDVARRTRRTAIRVGVRIALPGNRRLYEGLGYEVVSIQPHPKGGGDTATLVKRLAAPADVDLSDVAAEDFCYLTTVGRRSGRPHTIEIWFAASSDARQVYILSEPADAADWVRNIRAFPETTLRIADRVHLATARTLEDNSPEADEGRRLVCGKFEGWLEGQPLPRWAFDARVVAVAP